MVKILENSTSKPREEKNVMKQATTAAAAATTTTARGRERRGKGTFHLRTP
jgi:hypothetical protein